MIVSFFAAPAAAHDGADVLSFLSTEKSSGFDLPPASRAGETLWESGPSRPASADFQTVLIQGMLQGLKETDVSFEAGLRTGPGWADWSRGEIVKCFPNGRFWARVPVSGEKGAVLRLRAVSLRASPRGTLELFGIETRPAGGEPEDTRTMAPSELPGPGSVVKAADLAALGVLPREAWGAKPVKKPFRFEPMKPQRLTVHHTEAAQAMSREDAIHELQAIQQFHQVGRGWNDIAYQFLIDGEGRVWEGRPERVVGAHVLARNDGSVGISLMGSFHPPKNQQPTEAQLRSLTELLRKLSAAYGIPVGRIFAHREQEPAGHGTDCPGDILYARLGEIRKRLTLDASPLATRTSFDLDGSRDRMRLLIDRSLK